ncbi:MAG TPA: hypothetical protein VGQ71_13240 [Terriglobales bacterium]|jgi:hypothetical protein|nr:hypothetical protein [Terriglobales bacterium]
MSSGYPTNLPQSDQPRYCCVCGNPLDVQTQTFPNGAFKIFTCWQDKCSVFGRTCTDADLCNLDVLAKWNALLRFDTFTGQAIPLYVTYSNTGRDVYLSSWERRGAERKAERVPCVHCGGSGHQPTLKSHWLREAARQEYSCPSCRGTGTITASFYAKMIAAQKLAREALEARHG